VAQENGGGVLSTENIKNLTLINCNFANNIAFTDGGAL